MNAKNEVRTPGENDIDDVIANARAGRALKIEKPLDVQPPAQIVGLHDPTRTAESPINRQPEMSYESAFELLLAKKLNRPVLTEKGWLTPSAKIKTAA